MIKSSIKAIEDKWDNEENIEGKDQYLVNRSSKRSLENEENLKASPLSRR